MNDNIIKFPKSPKENFSSFEEFEEAIINNIRIEADESTEFLWSSVIMDIHDNGFELDRYSEAQISASIMILESIRSLHYLIKGIDHPLQEVSKDIFPVKIQKDTE